MPAPVQEEALSQKDHAEAVKGPLHNSSSPRDKEPKDTEWDKIRKWQEARIERRLRGEYESAVLHLQEVLDGNLHTPVTISSLRVEGAKSTRKSFLGFLLDPLLTSTPAEHSTLESVLHTTRHAAGLLSKTGLFTSVSAELTRASSPSSPPSSVDIVLKTKERGRYTLQSSTELGNNEGSANASATVRNVFGGAETLEVNLALGTRTRRSGGATLSAPLTRDLETVGSVNVFGLERDLTAYASCFEGLRGVKASIKGTSPTLPGVHEFGYTLVSRHIRALLPTASLSMRAAAGHSLKSSIFHSYVYDTRGSFPLSSPSSPSSPVSSSSHPNSSPNSSSTNSHPPNSSGYTSSSKGTYLKLSHEFAGLGGDAHFYKAEAEFQSARQVSPSVSVSLAGRAGVVKSLDRDGKSEGVAFSDRFQMGGPTSVRSFKANGLGPRDGADSTGGDIFYSLGVSVISKIPKKPHWPVNLHGWVNAGRLDVLGRSTPTTLITSPSISTGVGLIYTLDPVRVEVNFGVPVVCSRSDKMRKGVQVGVGVEFL